MSSFLEMIRSNLSSTVGNGYDSEPEDVKNTRRGFASLGRYDGDTELEYIDQKLDRSIRTFQKDKGLKEDGIIHPKGETEKALNRSFKKPNDDLFSGGLFLSDPVGSGLTNRSKDVKQVQKGLGFLDFLSDIKLFSPSGVIDTETDEGIKKFQTANELRIDGLLFPGGETQQTLSSILLKRSNAGEDKGGDAGDGDNSTDKPKEAPPKPRKPNCEGEEVAYVNAEAALYIAEQNLHGDVEELASMEASLSLLEQQLSKETSYIRGDKGKARGVGAAIGAGIGGYIASLPGAAVGLSVGAKVGPLVEEASDFVTGEKTDFELKVEIKSLKDEIEAQRQKIEGKLKPAVDRAKELAEQAKSDLIFCRRR